MSTVPSRYLIMPRVSLTDGILRIRAVQPEDIEPIRQWRNAQLDVLRQSEPLSPQAQQYYFMHHVWPELSKPEPSQILVAIEQEGILIGYGGLVHISWAYRRAEISFLLIPELERDDAKLATIFSRYLLLMQRLAFEDLSLLRLSTETYAHRVRHIALLEGAGFKHEGTLREHVLVDGKPMDALAHGILAREWSSQE